MRSSATKLLSNSLRRNRGKPGAGGGGDGFWIPASRSCDSQKMWNSTVPPDETSDHNSIDAGSSMRKPISLWPGMYHSPVTNALWEARRKMFENPTGDDSQSELAAKSPSRSRTSILYKFSSDFVLREQYRNPWNEIRTGKLVEDLDALAGTISFKVLTLIVFSLWLYLEKLVTSLLILALVLHLCSFSSIVFTCVCNPECLENWSFVCFLLNSIAAVVMAVRDQ